MACAGRTYDRWEVAAEQCFAGVVPKAVMDLDAQVVATHEGIY